jgi:hypothetical protein
MLHAEVERSEAVMWRLSSEVKLNGVTMRGQDGIRLGERLLPKRQGAHPPALLLFNHVGS